MEKLKKLGIVAMILILTLLVFVSNNVYATDDLSLTIQTDAEKYSVGNEIKVKIKLSQDVMTATYYLNYNSSAVSYKKSDDETSNLSVKDYPEDNTLRVVYADMSGEGTDEITVTFVANEKSDEEISFFLTNATFITTDRQAHIDDKISGIQDKASIQVENNTSNNSLNKLYIIIPVVLVVVIILAVVIYRVKRH